MTKENLIEQLEKDIILLSLKVEDEEIKRQKIRCSKEFQELAEKANNILKKQTVLIDSSQDSTQKLNEKKEQALEYFKEKDIKEYGQLIVKIRKAKYVNTVKLLDVLGGDIDNFLDFAEVKQKIILDAAKEEKKKGNTDFARQLKYCIKTKSEKIVGIDVVL